MPKTKTQGIVFGLIMSYAMAYGIEVYNVAIKEGATLSAGGLSNMTNIIFFDALIEASYMGIFVFIISNLYGNRFGAAFSAKHSDPEKENPYFCQLGRNRSQEFPDGIFLEFLCSRAVFSLDIW